MEVSQRAFPYQKLARPYALLMQTCHPEKLLDEAALHKGRPTFFHLQKRLSFI